MVINWHREHRTAVGWLEGGVGALLWPVQSVQSDSEELGGQRKKHHVICNPHVDAAIGQFRARGIILFELFAREGARPT